MGNRIHKAMGLRQYLASISDLTLPEPHSQVTKDFVSYVVRAHSWYKNRSALNPRINLVGFNLFIGPGPLIESEGGLNERVHTEFQHLKYGAQETLFDVRHKLPREISDAGQVILPGREDGYKSEHSQRIMVVTIANMLEAIDHYRGRHPSLKTK